MYSLSKIGFLFDLDGVLIDSEKEYSRMWAQINREYPTSEPSLESVIKGCTLDMILSRYYPDPDIKERVVSRLYALEEKMEYNFLPGAFELLNALQSRNIPLALVTSSNEKKMFHLDEEIPGLRQMFDFVVTADLISHSKPHPEGYLLGAEKIGVNPRNCVVFEDSLQGVKAGRNAGAYVVGVKGTIAPKLLSDFSDILVDSLKEIIIDDLAAILSDR